MKIKPVVRALAVAAPSGLGKCPGRRLSSFGGVHDSVESGAEILFGSSAFTGVFEFVLDAPSIVSCKGASTLPFLGFGLFDAGNTLLSGALFSPTTSASLTSVTLDAGSYHYAPVFPASGGVGASYAF